MKTKKKKLKKKPEQCSNKPLHTNWCFHEPLTRPSIGSLKHFDVVLDTRDELFDFKFRLIQFAINYKGHAAGVCTRSAK